MPMIDMRLLIISADATEPGLVTIKQTLDYLGAPYVTHITAHNPNTLTPEALSSGERAYYQGIILSTGNLAHARGSEWVSTLSDDEWQNLKTFEATFGIRQVTWYTYPTPEYGFQTPSAGAAATTDPVEAQLTPAGQSVFPYVNTANDLPIEGVYTYLAPPLLDDEVAPLLQDAAGNALALTRDYEDGRQNLALTFDSHPLAIHSLVLGYGVVHWLTRGLFLGERHSYLSAQIDDMFISDDVRHASVPCQAPPHTPGATFRMSGDDLSALTSWQTYRRNRQPTEQLRLTFAFNGRDFSNDHTDRDSLLAEVAKRQEQFYWVSHTYSHIYMDDMSLEQACAEIQRNEEIARAVGLTQFSSDSLVTPGMSGLNNPEALRAAQRCGVRYLVSDASRRDQANPSANAGVFSPLAPSLLMVPRRPTNLYYDVTTPEEWVAEYNCQYASHWGRDLAYDEILDRESQDILRYLLLGDMAPIMFHQSNAREYSRGHSLLTDLLDTALAKYERLMKTPVVSLSMDELGQLMAARMRYDAAHVTASTVDDRQISLSAESAATVPVTGLYSASAEMYGEQVISHIELDAQQTARFPLM